MYTHTHTHRYTEFNVFWWEDTFIFHTESQRHYIYRFWLRIHNKLGVIIQIQQHHPHIHSYKWSKVSQASQSSHIWLSHRSSYLFSAFRIFHKPPKNENSVITYSPSCHSKSVWLTFFCQTQNKVFSTLYRPLFSMQLHWIGTNNVSNNMSIENVLVPHVRSIVWALGVHHKYKHDH